METSTCLIPLSQGQSARVSPEDFDFLNQWKWSASEHQRSYGPRFYAVRFTWPEKQVVYMHRIIAKRFLAESKCYDHKNRETLDNRRENIRRATRSQNSMNITKRKSGTSRAVGVCWKTAKQRWQARLNKDGKAHHIGYFKTEQEAIAARRAAELKYFGEFAP